MWGCVITTTVDVETIPARVGNVDTQLIGYANEIRARAERRAGEMLADMPKAKGTAGGGNANVTGGNKIEPPVKEEKTLEELGITKKQSSDWQIKNYRTVLLLPAA